MKAKMRWTLATMIVFVALAVFQAALSQKRVYAAYHSASIQQVRQYYCSSLETSMEMVFSSDGRSSSMRPVTRSVIYVLGLGADGRFEMGKMSSTSQTGTARRGQELVGRGTYQVSGGTLVLIWDGRSRQTGQFRNGQQELLIDGKTYLQSGASAQSGASDLPPSTPGGAAAGSADGDGAVVTWEQGALHMWAGYDANGRKVMSERDVVGKWEAADGAGKRATFIFDKDDYVSISSEGRIFGGRKNGRDPFAQYFFAFHEAPVELDITLFDSAGGFQLKSLKGIVKFYKKGQTLQLLVKMAVNTDQRPTSFSAKSQGDSLLLTKVVE